MNCFEMQLDFLLLLQKGITFKSLMHIILKS